MCGIAGACAPDLREAEMAVTAICRQMIARGPDDGGVACFPAAAAGLALGNRRLAIIDPSPAGHQPMSDPARGTTIVFNGMIYNFADLRDRLAAEGESFDSDCDTEVILKAYGRYGADCVRHLRGMFAFAIWDARTGELFLARDRLGIKPLYFTQRDGRFLFASQVKALLASGFVRSRLAAAGLRSFLDYGAVSEPLTAIEGVLALAPAHTAVLRDGQLETARYWAPPPPVARLRREEAAATLRETLEDTVARHLVSDAPLGIFLSGGLDSSIIAALAVRRAARVRTVSVVFDSAALSEERHMRLVAEHVRSEHVELRLRPADLLDWCDDAFAGMDQPTFDGLNSYVVSRAAAGTGLKVALSGLGGDELFDGYRYLGRVTALERVRRLPAPLTRGAARALAPLARRGRGEKGIAWLAGHGGRGASYELLRRLFLPAEVHRLAPALAAMQCAPRPAAVDPRRDLFHQVSVLDLTNYTKNVLLRDTDAMSMANSLEVRVPFLDDRLVELALGLPASVKRGGFKSLLVEATRDLLPDEVLSRRKQGFVLPIAEWMRDELRDEVESTLRRPPSSLSPLIDIGAMAGVWRRYLRDGAAWRRPWALYALCRWARSIERAAPGAQEAVA